MNCLCSGVASKGHLSLRTIALVTLAWHIHYIMNARLKSKNHSAFLLYYHLVLSTKYRRRCIDAQMLERLEDLFREHRHAVDLHRKPERPSQGSGDRLTSASCCASMRRMRGRFAQGARGQAVQKMKAPETRAAANTIESCDRVHPPVKTHTHHLPNSRKIQTQFVKSSPS